jgi:hypothetical protein
VPRVADENERPLLRRAVRGREAVSPRDPRVEPRGDVDRLTPPGHVERELIHDLVLVHALHAEAERAQRAVRECARAERLARIVLQRAVEALVLAVVVQEAPRPGVVREVGGRVPGGDALGEEVEDEEVACGGAGEEGGDEGRGPVGRGDEEPAKRVSVKCGERVGVGRGAHQPCRTQTASASTERRLATTSRVVLPR